MQEQSFLEGCYQHTGEITIGFDQNKNNLIKHLLKLWEKKNSTIFPDFISIFQTFPTSGKFLGKFQDFFKKIRLGMNPTLTFCPKIHNLH